MNVSPQQTPRLRFLARVVAKECRHLAVTDQRLFALPFTAERASQLAADPDMAERVDAFVSRFGRLQDTVGDKLLPALLVALGEKPGATIDNLDRAERLGLIDSTSNWLTLRNLRNKMVHEYVEDPALLADALQTGHMFVDKLITASQKMIEEIEHRIGSEPPNS